MADGIMSEITKPLALEKKENERDLFAHNVLEKSNRFPVG